MRVLFLTTSATEDASGSGADAVLRLAVALADTGTEVRVVAPALDGQPREERRGDVLIERFRVPRHSEAERAAQLAERAPGPSLFRPRPLALLRVLGSEFVRAVQSRRDFEPDVLHAIRCVPDGLVGTWVSELAGVPLVATVTEADLRLARRVAASRPTLRHVLRRSSGVTATSAGAAAELTRLLSLPEPLVVPLPSARSEVEVTAPRHPDRLLCHVRGDAEQWASVVLRALAATRAQVALDVIGDPAARPALERLAAELRIPDRVRWLGQPDEATRNDLLASATAVIVAADDSAAERLAAEALLSQAPVVAVGTGPASLLQHERTGIRVEGENPIELARAVDDLLARPDRGASLGAAGRLHTLASHAPESVARRLVRLYHDTIGASPT